MLNRGFTYREQLDRRVDGLCLLELLTRRYDHSGEEEWRRRIAAGEVLLDGRVASPGDGLRAGQRLVWNRPPWEEPDAPTDFAVLYRDDDLLAVAKPSGLPTLPGAGYLENTLLMRVRRHAPEAAPVHRLGRGTSGLVLFGRTAAARRRLSADWRNGQIGKEYLALATGAPAEPRFRIDLPIGPVPYTPLGSLHAASPQGKPSRSEVRLLEQREDAFVASVRISTGRPHQIRIHLAAAGHPLVGDPLYGAGGLPLPGTTATPGETGYRLHAAALRFDHPGDRRTVELFCAPPPVLRPSLC